MSDWRLQGQETYLMGVELHWAKWIQTRANWDHDHCEFCSRKFSTMEGDLNEGYTTKDEYHWISEDCYNEFKDKFGWKVVGVKAKNGLA